MFFRQIFNSGKGITQEKADSELVRTYKGEDAFFGALAYFPFVALAIILLRRENSEFVLFHARQSIVILILSIIGGLLLPFFFKILVAVFTFGLIIFGIYKALSGRKWYFPLITELAQSIEI